MKNLIQHYTKKSLPHIIAVLAFVIVGIVYFHPSLEGKKLHQTDIVKGKGMNHQTNEYNDNHEDVALWNNYMFSGMPTYQVGCDYWSNFQFQVRKILYLGIKGPIGYFLLYAVGFYILLLVLGVNPWVAIGGAFAFAFSSYNLIIIEAGHIWKVITIGLMAPTFAGFIMIFRKKYLWGLVLSTFFLSLQFFSNHLQMTYYMFLMVGVYLIYELISYIQRKEIKQFLIALSLFFVSLIIAIGVNADRLWTTYEYSKYTIRGKSELTLNKEDKSEGLDRSYITKWSYGIEETLTMLIPNTKGGASGALAENKEALDNADRRFREQIAQQSHYWGNQTFTFGPVYFGAIVMFLFVLGMFIVSDKIKWVLLIATVFSILLAWGKNFLPLTDLFIDYFPLYNKFRAVASILVVAGLTVPIISILALNKIIQSPGVIKNNMKAFYWAFGLTGGLSLILYLMPEAFLNFLSTEESKYFTQLKASNPDQLAGIKTFTDSLINTRVAIFKNDAIRSFLFITVGAATLFMYSRNVLSRKIALVALPLIFIIDMFAVDKRYLNNDDFKPQRQIRNTFRKSKADSFILNDKSESYRVVNIGMNPFTETFTSYFHESIGGYHGAKLKKYQELIEYQLSGEVESLRKVLSEQATFESIQKQLQKSNTLNMLNTKYIIYNNNTKPLINNFAHGNAWFVNNFKVVENADKEILTLSEANLKKTLIVDKRYRQYVKGIKTDTINFDSSASIELIEKTPNHVLYNYKSNYDRVAVLSEIYYPAGWNAYLDGEKTEYFRGNYLLRCIRAPKGEHQLEFRFEPVSYFAGKRISQISVLLFIVLFGSVIYINRNKIKLQKDDDKK